MDYAQNFKKYQEMAKKGPHRIIQGVVSPFLVQQYHEFAAISSNLIKTAIFKNVLALWVLEMIK